MLLPDVLLSALLMKRCLQLHPAGAFLGSCTSLPGLVLYCCASCFPGDQTGTQISFLVLLLPSYLLLPLQVVPTSLACWIPSTYTLPKVTVLVYIQPGL